MIGLLFVKWIHVLAAITAVGTNITYGIWIRQASKEPDSLLFVLRIISWIDRRLANPGYALLLVSGWLIGDQLLSRPTSWGAMVAAISVIVVLILSEIARERFQRVIDRQFFREKYKLDPASVYGG